MQKGEEREKEKKFIENIEDWQRNKESKIICFRFLIYIENLFRVIFFEKFNIVQEI